VLEVADWLRANLPAPATSSVVHGDFRLGNVLVAPDHPRVAAVLDWELAAVGDPRADLGYLVATWSDAGSRQTVLELSPVTAEPGFLTRDELVERYAGQRGEGPTDLRWFEVLALWKASVFCEAIYGRYLRGELDSPFARSLDVGVPRLAQVAAAIASRA
jgi:aminoglycoside phosphotransferase (APT) family kinase protein